MVLVYLNNGECIEVQDAVRVAVEDDLVVCYDRLGRITATFPARQVETYTANEDVAEQLKEDICEDLTVLGEEGAPEELV